SGSRLAALALGLGFFLGLLRLLDDDLDDLYLGQSVGTLPILPLLLILQLLDALAARQNAAGALQRIFATETFINRHRHTCLVSSSRQTAGQTASVFPS